MKQTAVEWLIDMLVIENEIALKGENYKLIEQAKQMEKEQRNTNFICHGCGTHHSGENDDQVYEVCKQCLSNL